LSYPGPTTT